MTTTTACLICGLPTEAGYRFVTSAGYIHTNRARCRAAYYAGQLAMRLT